MSNAVQLDRISQIVGYKIVKGDFKVDSPNLPQRIAILAEANTANQGTLDTDAVEITTAKRAGELYGYGSPIHQIARILRPNGQVGVGGIPTYVYAQEEPAGATAKVIDITPTGTATGNGTHTIKINGRTGVDGSNYQVTISDGDDEAAIVAKIADVVNDVLGTPVIATTDSTPDKAILTAKWKGLTSNDIDVTIDTGDDALGVTYAVTVDAAGAGSPSVTPALNKFEENWNTIVISGYGLNSTIMGEFESFNGIPDPNSPTGRWNGEIFKPFIAISGTTESDADTLVAITDARKDDVTIAPAVAPGSKGLQLEAAANYGRLFALIAQNSPHLDIQDQSLPDMPVGESIGDFDDYNERDRLVKAGCSTAIKSNGKYVVKDFVTTYHPVGEIPPQYRYPRNLNIDWNMRFGELLLVQANVIGNAIAADSDIVEVANVIKPKQYKQILVSYADAQSRKGLIADPEFTKESITVDISGTNPDRLDSFYRYKRTGFGRIASTTAEAGFNFGS